LPPILLQFEKLQEKDVTMSENFDEDDLSPGEIFSNDPKCISFCVSAGNVLAGV